MTQLSNPTVYSQLSAPAANRWDDCGETCVACCLTDVLGQRITPTDVVGAAVSKAQMDSNGETTAQDLIEELADWGVTGKLVTGPISSYLPAALSRRHRVICNIGCNSCGVPASAAVTGITHWVVGYGYNPPMTACMNPLGNCTTGGMLASYNLSPPIDQKFGIEIEAVAINDRAIVTQPPPPNPVQAAPPGVNLGALLLLLGGGAAVVGWELHSNTRLLAEIKRDERRATAWIRSQHF